MADSSSIKSRLLAAASPRHGLTQKAQSLTWVRETNQAARAALRKAHLLGSNAPSKGAYTPKTSSLPPSLNRKHEQTNIMKYLVLLRKGRSPWRYVSGATETPLGLIWQLTSNRASAARFASPHYILSQGSGRLRSRIELA